MTVIMDFRVDSVLIANVFAFGYSRSHICLDIVHFVRQSDVVSHLLQAMLGNCLCQQCLCW